MPIIKSAIKRMKQSQVSRDRNRHYRSHMKSMIKLLLGYVEKGEMEKAKKLLPEVESAIDTAAKKRIVHKNNAARKKSRVQRILNAGPVKKEEKVSKKASVEGKAPKAVKSKVGKKITKKVGKEVVKTEEAAEAEATKTDE